MGVKGRGRQMIAKQGVVRSDKEDMSNWKSELQMVGRKERGRWKD